MPLRGEPTMKVFPTRVGMNRSWLLVWLLVPCVPHTRGDEPQPCCLCRQLKACSPHAWGLFPSTTIIPLKANAF